MWDPGTSSQSITGEQVREADSRALAQIFETAIYIFATSLGDVYTHRSLRSNSLRHMYTLWNILDN